jgi:hypothetical protein
MSDEPRRKKRTEKLSDAFAARLAREIGPSGRLSAIAGDARAHASERQRERNELASSRSEQHGFTRCPHCHEYVPRRDTCRACGTPIN